MLIIFFDVKTRKKGPGREEYSGTYLEDLGHSASEGAVSDEDRAVDLDAGGQRLVRAGDLGVVALEGVVGGDLQLLVYFELDGLVVLQQAGADLGALRVEHLGDGVAGTQLEGLVQEGDEFAVGLVITVGEVEAGNVHAGVDHLAELFDALASGAERADNLGAALGGVDGLEDVGELDVGTVAGDSLIGGLHLCSLDRCLFTLVCFMSVEVD